MGTRQNIHTSKSKKGTHAAETSKAKPHYFILILFILLVIAIGIYFAITYLTTSKPASASTDNPLSSSISNMHQFENSDYLSSKDLCISVENGISKVKGTVTNNSNDILRKLDCVYSLLDSSNNVVLEFDISIAKIEANSSALFSSVSTLDLSNVVNYTVKLAE